MRCTDSAMFNHEPPGGVYNGRMPALRHHCSKSQLWWPCRLSQISSSRSGGSPSAHHGGVSGGSQSSQRRPGPGSLDAGGQVARIASSSRRSQGCRTVLGARSTGSARTSPLAGRNNVSSWAVPPRTYSWGCCAGSPVGCQDAPGWGIAC